MADFPTYPALLSKTSVLSDELDDSTPVTTSAVPIGAGTFPYEAYATGVDFYITTVNGTATVGDLTATVQCSANGSTWFDVPDQSFLGPVPNAEEWRLSVPVGSRQWRFIRLSFLCENAQSGTISTVDVEAQLRGMHSPYVKS